MTVSPFPILASGPAWWAVEKPAGISIHNDPGNDLISRMTHWHGAGRLHAVHRLDQDTSGVVLVAADSATKTTLSTAFSRKQTIKIYLALVHGKVPPGKGPHGWGRWRWPLGKAKAGRKDPIGRGPKQSAETLYRVARTGRRYSLVICRPITGRTHQIRRHARKAGFAVVGDARYGTPRAARTLERLFGWNRLGLHALAVTLPLPGSDRPLAITSLGLPEDFRRLIDVD